MQGDTKEGLKALSQGVDFDGLRSPFCAQVIDKMIAMKQCTRSAWHLQYKLDVFTINL